MSRWPNLKQLHYLVALAECENFNRAAKACFVSQSTLSTGIQNLEELLGVQLIERDNKSFIMTPIGLEVVQRARQLLSETKDLLEMTASRGGSLSGPLRLGCIPTIAPFLLSPLVTLCGETYPDLDLLLREDTSDNLLKLLEAGELDLLLLALPYDLGSFHSRVVGQDPFRLVLHEKLIDSYEANPARYAGLPDHSLFLLEREHCLTDHALSACQLADQAKINPFAATSLYTLVQMVSHQQGATFLPEMALRAGILERTELVAVAPQGQMPHRDIGLVWRPSSCRVEAFAGLGRLVTSCLR
ncbi:LysR substrate-binding domain-containing protein [Pseudaeromonas paramecii]|uniref:Hydrogen peroxide-inducible genes activator n=1 Tax=Pseudaeromonas paramecii TaxID=2138166 RepID=A0ABP8Q6A4_9GAMM